MLSKLIVRPLKYTMLLCMLFVANLTLKSQSHGEGDMTQFYIVSIVFVVLIVGGVLSFFVTNKKKRD